MNAAKLEIKLRGDAIPEYDQDSSRGNRMLTPDVAVDEVLYVAMPRGSESTPRRSAF